MTPPSQHELRPYFDRGWYTATYGTKSRVRWQPWQYYLRRGWRKGHAPHRLFDAAWYLACHADVHAAGLNPLAHYVAHGWREGRQPHPLFDPTWYRGRYPEVEATGTEPLLHYLREGWRRGFQPHPAFDAAWYLARNPDVASAGLEPLAHYLEHGWHEGRNPHPLFDVRWYLARNPDIDVARVEPLGHFLAIGWRERRQVSARFSPDHYLAQRPAAAGSNPLVHFLVHEYEPVAHDAGLRAAAVARFLPAAARPPSARPAAVAAPADGPAEVRAIAMYLPQFHRIPENDAWWGAGFTEWTNVRRARSLFTGHDQPRVPHADLGYYDLDDGRVLERQAELARRHGIHGFCFYHYWFAGRRILERPLERLRAAGRPDFPFCICWANENWTRTWDGLDEDVLLEQRHSPETDERFLQELLPALRDRRYITVAGRPLVAVYRPGLLADAPATAARWRRIAAEAGLPGLYLASVQSFDQADPRTLGFDAAIQFPPLQIETKPVPHARLAGLARDFRGAVCDYQDAVRQALARPLPDYPLFRGVMPGWDNTPRRGERATIWAGASPEGYGRWLAATVERMRREQPPERRLVFINAWNEWGEGAHLEPDAQHGYRYLEETARALGRPLAGAGGMDEHVLRLPEATARPEPLRRAA